MCAVKNAADADNTAFVVSITHLEFAEKGEIYEKINEYKNARIKWLKAEEEKDRRLGLEERIKIFMPG
jgi:hypothetical protein